MEDASLAKLKMFWKLAMDYEKIYRPLINYEPAVPLN
jgi:hypothetical protein